MHPLHASEIRCYQLCPRKWQFAYEARRIPIEVPTALSVGRQVHAWLEAWWAGRDTTLPDDLIGKACCLGYRAVYAAPPSNVTGVEVPFTAAIGGVECAGTVDALTEQVVEHKTTSSDIAPGAHYWAEMTHCSIQTTLYLAAFPGRTILYDVIRKPSLRKLRHGKPNEETDQEFVARCLEAMLNEPDKYFARYTLVSLESEREETVRDIVSVDRLRRGKDHPRNVASCMAFGRRCGYWECCHGSADISDDSLFTRQTHGI